MINLLITPQSPSHQLPNNDKRPARGERLHEVPPSDVEELPDTMAASGADCGGAPGACTGHVSGDGASVSDHAEYGRQGGLSAVPGAHAAVFVCCFVSAFSFIFILW